MGVKRNGHVIQFQVDDDEFEIIDDMALANDVPRAWIIEALVAIAMERPASELEAELRQLKKSRDAARFNALRAATKEAACS